MPPGQVCERPCEPRGLAKPSFGVWCVQYAARVGVVVGAAHGHRRCAWVHSATDTPCVSSGAPACRCVCGSAGSAAGWPRAPRHCVGWGHAASRTAVRSRFAAALVYHCGAIGVRGALELARAGRPFIFQGRHRCMDTSASLWTLLQVCRKPISMIISTLYFLEGDRGPPKGVDNHKAFLDLVDPMDVNDTMIWAKGIIWG